MHTLPATTAATAALPAAATTLPTASSSALTMWKCYLVISDFASL